MSLHLGFDGVDQCLGHGCLKGRMTCVVNPCQLTVWQRLVNSPSRFGQANPVESSMHQGDGQVMQGIQARKQTLDRKSTRLNSSH